MREKFSGNPLEWLTIGYLTFPLAIFVLGWISPILALSLLYFIAINLIRWNPTIDRRSDLRLGVLSFAILILWVGFSGAGGFAQQNWDYLKHNAVLGDLIQQSWPVRYPSDRGEEQLVYYIAYYLPAALVGKLGCWSWALIAQFTWTLIGACLGVLWFKKISRIRHDVVCVFLFVSIGGLDLIGRAILLDAGTWPHLGEHLEHWTRWGYLIYSSNTASFFWAPQHAIPTWLATSLVLNQRSAPRFTNLVFLCTVTTLWSPFVALGILPFCLLIIAKRIPTVFQEARGSVWPALFLGLSIALFYSSRSAQLNLSPIWNQPAGNKALFQTVVLWICEFGLYSLLVFKFVPKERLPLLGTAVVTLVGSGLVKSGHYNDFTMRVSQPANLVLWMIIAGTIADRGLVVLRTERAMAALYLALALGSASSIQEIWRARALTFSGPWNIPQPVARSLLLLKPDWLPRQYLGNKNQFFFQYVAGESE